MGDFRRTDSGALEVLQAGVWTPVPAEAAKEIDRLRDLLKQANGDLLTIAAEPMPNETNDDLVRTYRLVAERASKTYSEALRYSRG